MDKIGVYDLLNLQRDPELIAAVSLERLVKFRGYLAQPPSLEHDLAESLEKYVNILEGFTIDERVEQLSTEALLSSSQKVKVWSEGKTSQLLILAGRNEPSTFERDDLL